MYYLKGISKSFGELNVLRDISMEIPRNKITAILGPSGCGKTTMLNIMSGLMEPDFGFCEGFSMSKISYLFQEPRLLPWKNVYQNIDFVLKDIMPEAERNEVIKAVLDSVGLSEYADFDTSRLSGGMKQRVAFARAFAYPSDILLMDEPFKSLDLELKFILIKMFRDIWQRNRRTVVFVTHDVQAALILGDIINILGPRPSYVQHIIENNIQPLNRNHSNEEFLKLEGELYQYILQKL